MKIALIGTFPPPIGGTSIHIKRLYEKLSTDGFEVVVYNTSGQKENNIKDCISVENYRHWIMRYIFSMEEDIIHSHTHEWKERAVLSLAASIKHKKSIFTFHSLRDEYAALSILEKLLVRLTFSKADVLICTSIAIKKKLLEWGCPSKKLFQIGPYINPTQSEMQEMPADDIVEFRHRHKFVVVANASNNNHYNGSDLYGLDMCIYLIDFLKAKTIDCGLIFAQTKITDSQYFQDICKLIENKGLEDRVLIVRKKMSLIPILRDADIFLRPTNTDSWPLSVSESLTLGIPVIASDACKREQGAILFKNRNQSDFNKVVLDCLNNLCDISRNGQVVDSYKEIVNLYKDLMNS